MLYIIIITYTSSFPPLQLSSSYGDYGLSSSQSIDLTFHSVSTVTHNRLTVDTMAPTQMEPSHERRDFAAEDGEEYFDRLDSKRCVVAFKLCVVVCVCMHKTTTCRPTPIWLQQGRGVY